MTTARPRLRVELRYGTYAGATGQPTKENRKALDEVASRIKAEMGDDAFMVSAGGTDTASWPSRHIELSYSLFSDSADELSKLARAWEPKLVSQYGMWVHVNASTD